MVLSSYSDLYIRNKQHSECLIPFGEGHLRGHCNLALASLNGDHTATKVPSLAVHFNALLQKLFLQLMSGKNVTLYRRHHLCSTWATSSLKTNKCLWVSEFVDFKCIRLFCLNEANSYGLLRAVFQLYGCEFDGYRTLVLNLSQSRWLHIQKSVISGVIPSVLIHFDFFAQHTWLCYM